MWRPEKRSPAYRRDRHESASDRLRNMRETGHRSTAGQTIRRRSSRTGARHRSIGRPTSGCRTELEDLWWPALRDRHRPLTTPLAQIADAPRRDGMESAPRSKLSPSFLVARHVRDQPLRRAAADVVTFRVVGERRPGMRGSRVLSAVPMQKEGQCRSGSGS
jgi:hypothetical protein